MTELIITADDYGYADCVDAGIVEAVGEGLLDAVAVMVDRDADLWPLLDTGVDLGLHLAFEGTPESPRANDGDRESAEREARRQIDRFVELAGSGPAFLNGHHHCHARPGLGAMIGDLATEIGAAVRAVGPRYRRLLRCRSVDTPNLLIGRLDQDEPVDPGLAELDPDLGVVEWMVHPGRECEQLNSRYSEGRDEDLACLSGLELPAGISRTSFTDAFPLSHPVGRSPGDGRRLRGSGLAQLAAPRRRWGAPVEPD